VSAQSMKDHTFTTWRGDAAYSARVRHYPVHNYNFDFISFNFVFRHLIDPYRDFEIGVVEPNWDLFISPGFEEIGDPSGVFLYTGKTHIEYLGDDIYRKVECHKYRISGAGLNDKVGFIWVNKEKGHFENFEHPHANNPAWDSLKMELQSTEWMSVGEWHQYIGYERERKNRIRIEGTAYIALPEISEVKTREEAWAEDIQYFVSKLENDHPYLFHTMRPQDFNQVISTLRNKVESLEDHEIIVELGRILAMVEDGHTTALLGHDITRKATGFRKVPVKLGLFEDGLFIIAATDEYAEAIGAQVIRIGKFAVDEAIDKATPLVSRSKKNEMMLKNQIPDLLITVEVLHALGIINDPGEVDFHLQDAGGDQIDLKLKPIEFKHEPFDGKPVVHGGGENWTTTYQKTGSPTPIYLSREEEPFWYTYLGKSKILYCQYNAVTNKPNETFSDFCQRMFEFLDETQVEKFVVDLRFNSGGNGTLNWPLIEGIREREAINQPGKIFTIIGRKTFSAAMMAAVALERGTRTLFVGEPTGASPNHIGDSNILTLPNSGATMIHSSIYWQLSDPDDERLWIAPDIPAPLSSEDYRLGRDPALDAIMNYQVKE
ncbi:MAG: hypothetical protein MUO76_18375, partial [Anaerolineaceae bacterium]|nr:hypothetical protein [Anaerolineaceae bacterium]